jgi:peroxiredoxin
MKTAIALTAMLAMTTGAWAAPEIGKTAPDFTATDINGQTVRLADYKGKIVVLESYNQDCPFCHNHYSTGAMQELQRDLTSRGVVWLIVDSVGEKNSSYRSPDAAKKEWASDKMAATAWIDDHSGEVGHKYGMRTTPHMFVIDKSGILAYEGAIDDRAEPEGDPRTAHNYVRDAVQKLQAGEKLDVAETKPYGCGVHYGR